MADESPAYAGKQRAASKLKNACRATPAIRGWPGSGRDQAQRSILIQSFDAKGPGEPACGRPRSTRDAGAPLPEPADAVSACGNDRLSQGIVDRIDRPPMPRGASPRTPRRLVAGQGRIPWRGCGSISLTSQSTGRSHRLKDCAAPPIFSRRPEEGRRQKIGSSACRLRRSLRDP